MKNGIIIIIAAFVFCLGGCKTSTKGGGPARMQKLKPPLKFLIIGDSLIEGYLGIMMVRELERYPGISARRYYLKSTGLSEYHRYNWKEKTLRHIVQYGPDILVVLFGANDSWAVRQDDGRLIYHWQAGVGAMYALRVRQYLRAVLPHVKRVYWIAQPATSNRSFSPRYFELNKIYREECGNFVNIRYVPAWEWTSRDGKYTPYLTNKSGITGSARIVDDIHFSPFGGKVIAERFVEFIREDIELNQ
jgi:uncharacterized protein